MAGIAGNNGNVVFSVAHKNQKEMLQAEQPWANDALYPQLQSDGTFEAVGSGSSNKAFGSSQEFSGEDLREYHYMFSMPYFEDQVELGEFESHNQALETIETNLRNS